MATKPQLILAIGMLITTGMLYSCGNPYCPQMPNSATGGKGNELVIPIELVNREDTLNLGDTLFFRSPQPVLPLTYNDTYFDEKISIPFFYTFSEFHVGGANGSFLEFTNENETLAPQAPPYEHYINKKRILGINESFTLGFIPQDTGTFYFHLVTYPMSVSFSESGVPDYKGHCDRSTNHFKIELTNLREQPLSNALGMNYREILCVGAVCDTHVMAYTFRVEP